MLNEFRNGVVVRSLDTGQTGIVRVVKPLNTFPIGVEVDPDNKEHIVYYKPQELEILP